jgi:hypothetical protein
LGSVEDILNTSYQGDKDFWWLSFNGQIADYWIKKAKYSNYNKFIDLFDNNIGLQQHEDHGGAILSYNPDFKYPYQVDPDQEYMQFIKEALQVYRFESIDFEKCWWIKYPVGTYSGLHTHQPLRKLTSVLFLDTIDLHDDKPLSGKLKCITQNPVTGELVSDLVKCIAGDVVIMDGKVFHGVYPTLQERRAFVCDFTYEVKFD